MLPDAFGLSSGEIEVVTAMGSVLLNRPYQATTVSVFEAAPTKPVILDLSLDIIDNMLIVTPPKEETLQEEQTSTTQNDSVLDFNDLDIDYLAEDFLEESNLEFTELDINYLVEEEEEQLGLATSVNLTGTNFGQDTQTQITTIIAGQVISLQRKVNQNLQLDLNSGNAYTLILIQDGVSNIIKINGGSDSVITITQGSG